jgi:hypothetical protein
MTEHARDIEGESASTREEEEREAAAAHVADRPPTPEEEEAAEERPLSPGVAEHEREMAERGVEARGEGRID